VAIVKTGSRLKPEERRVASSITLRGETWRAVERLAIAEDTSVSRMIERILIAALEGDSGSRPRS